MDSPARCERIFLEVKSANREQLSPSLESSTAKRSSVPYDMNSRNKHLEHPLNQVKARRKLESPVM